MTKRELPPEPPLIAIEDDVSPPRSGFSRVWRVWDRYDRTDTEIFVAEKASTVRRYSPAERRTIATEFAKVRASDPDSLFDFVLNWGLLGQTRLLPYDPGKLHEPESIEWGLAHAACVRFCLDVAAAMSSLERDREASSESSSSSDFGASVETAFLTLNTTRSGDRKSKSNRSVVVRTPHGPRVNAVSVPGVLLSKGGSRVQFLEWEDRVPLVENVLRYALQLVNSNISGLTSRFDIATASRRPRDRTGPQRAYGVAETRSFSALIEVIWWHVGQTLGNAGSVSRCATCGSVFYRSRRTQIYCPSPSKREASSCERRMQALRKSFRNTPE